MSQKQSVLDHHGFTVVELMIATLVFTTTLMVITAGVISFSKDYYKGTTSASVQDTARNTIDTVSQAIQFSTSEVIDDGSSVVCAGGYIFKYGLAKATAETAGGITMERLTDASRCDSGEATVGVKQKLIPEGMRLLVLRAEGSGSGPYVVRVGVAKGDADLFCADGTRCGAMSESELQTAITAGEKLSCNGGAGSQFCYVSYLETIVTKRM